MLPNKTLSILQRLLLSECAYKSMCSPSSVIASCSSMVTLEGMRVQWEQFGRGFEAFSVWISDKEKQLDPLKSSSAPLEQQISTVKVP